MLNPIRRVMAVAIVALTVGAAMTSAADARIGGGGSSGSRGIKSFTAPRSTPTTPGTVSPLQRSQPQAAPQAGRANPAVAAPQSRFGGGFGGLLMGGLLGAGLFGLLSGSGFLSGLGSLAGMMGLLLQVAIIGGLAWLLMSLLRSRGQPAAQAASAGYQPPGGNSVNRSAGFGFGGGGGSLPPLTIGQNDYGAFERLLAQSQDAYSRGDLGTLRGMATPEMAGYFAEDLSANAQKNVRNEVSDARLLQGDLSETWREADGEYATVAMRYAIIDTMVDARSGQIVSGSRTEPQEVTEVWTFVRPAGGRPEQWRISAIQQAG